MTGTNGGTALRLTGVGKRYRIRSARTETYATLRDSLAGGARRLFSRASGRGETPDTEEVRALRDLDLTIEPGERVGLIGRNGAGKSTLLKVLSRITAPTEGNIEIRGRMASLLEVGTGFHPELTGRENIFLNGSILGMDRAEVRRRFDEIVAFAEVERFLEVPVKRYSSGMYVRLAFAVAAHLEPEILLVDEVLAVGDAHFQKKCLGRMEEVGREGRTVLFVSHNMGLIQALCDRAVLLDAGRKVADGPVDAVIDEYWERNAARSAARDIASMPRTIESPETDRIRLTRCDVIDTGDRATDSLRFREPLAFRCAVRAEEAYSGVKVVIGVDNHVGQRVFTADSEEFGLTFDLAAGEERTVEARFDGLHLMPGRYQIAVASVRRGRHGLDTVQELGAFDVTEQVLSGHPALVTSGVVSGTSRWSLGAGLPETETETDETGNPKEEVPA